MNVIGIGPLSSPSPTARLLAMFGFVRVEYMPPGWRWVRLAPAVIPGDRFNKAVPIRDTWVVWHRGMNIGAVRRDAQGWHAENRGTSKVVGPVATRVAAVGALCAELRDQVRHLAAR